MIGEDSDAMWGSLKIVFPLFKGLDDGEEFSIVDVVISLGRSERFREVGAGMQVAVIIGLHEDSSRSGEGGVSHDGKGFGDVWHGKDRPFEEGLL